MARKRKKKWTKRTKQRGLAAMLARTRLGRKAIEQKHRWWGVKIPPEILTLDLPGKSKHPVVFTALGISPAVTIANGPKGKATSIRRHRHHGRILCADPNGRRLFILKRRQARHKVRGRNRLKFLGWAAQTEYWPTKRVERSKSPKRNKRWYHLHHDENGVWPKIYMDSGGNIIYGPGSYAIKGKKLAWLHS